MGSAAEGMVTVAVAVFASVAVTGAPMAPMPKEQRRRAVVRAMSFMAFTTVGIAFKMLWLKI